MRIRVMLVLAALGCSNNESTHTAGGERWSYHHAVESVARRQAADDSIAVPGARSILLTTGRPTPRAIVLLHGLTDSPRQFERFAYLLRADGNNVYVPRLPQHGLIDGTARMLGALTADQLRGIADSVVDDATGLGDSVVVVGLSLGGTVAAWIAQHRMVTRAVLIAPAIDPAHIPSLLTRPIIGLAWRLPSITRMSAPDTARPDREVGFNTRAVGQLFALGESVRGDASHSAPATKQIAILVNAGDRTVRSSATEALAEDWSEHGASVAVFELPDSLRLPHNILDSQAGESDARLVLDLLRQLTYGESPPSWVRAVTVGYSLGPRPGPLARPSPH